MLNMRWRFLNLLRRKAIGPDSDDRSAWSYTSDLVCPYCGTQQLEVDCTGLHMERCIACMKRFEYTRIVVGGTAIHNSFRNCVLNGGEHFWHVERWAVEKCELCDRKRIGAY